MNQDRKILDLWELNGKLVNKAAPLFCLDQGKGTGKLIFAVTIVIDSVRLHCAQRGKTSLLLKDRFIDKIVSPDIGRDVRIDNVLTRDMNRDGYPDLVFSINAGYSLQPRAIYIYDFKNDSLRRTQSMRAYITPASIVDGDNDGYPEIFCQSYAPANDSVNLLLPYTDSSAWLMAFDHRLRHLFPPKEYPGYTSTVLSVPVSKDVDPYIIVHYTSRFPGSPTPSLTVFNMKGIKLETKELTNEIEKKDIILLEDDNNPEYPLILLSDGTFYKIDKNLRFLGKGRNKDLILCHPVMIDLDNDMKKEYIFLNEPSSKLVVLRKNLKNSTFIQLPPINQNFVTISTIYNKSRAPEIFIQHDKQFLRVSYEENFLYYLRIPTYLGIYFILVLFVYLILYLQRTFLKDRYLAEKKISELQLMLLKNQLDPHFTFNAISSISSLIQQKNLDEADEYVHRFSALIRSSVVQGDKPTRTLAEETEFTANFLEFSKRRFPGGMEYFIDIPADVDQNTIIPKMIIQIFVENALQHGLKGIGKKGEIRIEVARLPNDLSISITDNGIGRLRAGQNGSSGTGRGLELMNQYIGIFNKYNEKHIRYTVNDLYTDKGLPAGTKVEVMVPVLMDYQFFKA